MDEEDALQSFAVHHAVRWFTGIWLASRHEDLSETEERKVGQLLSVLDDQ